MRTIRVDESREGLRWFPVSVVIERVKDGAVRTYRTDEIECATPDCHCGPNRWHDYIWREGNYSCDCNRYLFFQRAASEGEDDELECGEKEYRIMSITDEDGILLYAEERPS